MHPGGVWQSGATSPTVAPVGDHHRRIEPDTARVMPALPLPQPRQRLAELAVRPAVPHCPVTGMSARLCAPDLGGLSWMANDQAADCHRSWPAVLLDGDRVGRSSSDGGTDRLLTTHDVQELGRLCWHDRQTGRIDCQRADLRVTGHSPGHGWLGARHHRLSRLIRPGPRPIRWPAAGQIE